MWGQNKEKQGKTHTRTVTTVQRITRQHRTMKLWQREGHTTLVIWFRFQKLTKVADSGYKVPGQKHFSKAALPQLYAHCGVKVEKLPPLLTCSLAAQKTLS